jgi:hypothetical protein
VQVPQSFVRLTTSQVFEVLSHISKRVKPDTSVTIPLEKLTVQFLSVDSSPLQKNFVLVYLQMGFSRAEAAVSGAQEVVNLC